jgi:Inner membrane protein YgaP-like, transmembrane domain
MSIAESFAQTGFAKFINSPTGRIARIVVGLALIAWGYTQRGAMAGVVLLIVGLIPLAAGLFNLCLVSALLGGPISGARLRKDKPAS